MDKVDIAFDTVCKAAADALSAGAAQSDQYAMIGPYEVVVAIDSLTPAATAH